MPSVETNVTNYPHYFKDVSVLSDIDIYQVCKLFNIQDSSGCLQHAIKKLLVSGNRGYKDNLQDIKEARDTLNRYLEINQ